MTLSLKDTNLISALPASILHFQNDQAVDEKLAAFMAGHNNMQSLEDVSFF